VLPSSDDQALHFCRNVSPTSPHCHPGQAAGIYESPNCIFFIFKSWRELFSFSYKLSVQINPADEKPTIIDSSITRLLVLTKQMLQGMEQWSQGQIGEEDVSLVLLLRTRDVEEKEQEEERRGADVRYLIFM